MSYYKHLDAFTDITHVRYFTPFSFDYFDKSKQLALDYEYVYKLSDTNFKIEKVELQRKGRLGKLFKFLTKLSKSIRMQMYITDLLLPAAEIYFELRVIKN
ncbi:MAG: hypothetical protein QW625_00680 [Candidatus Nanoarchaeia archaeon]